MKKTKQPEADKTQARIDELRVLHKKYVAALDAILNIESSGLTTHMAGALDELRRRISDVENILANEYSVPIWSLY